jgi:ubiquinone/menaquinone biosynthesis C-methylase UbiE
MFEFKPKMQSIKDRMREVWSAGDFGVIAKIIEPEGYAFINRLNINADSKVLDVACGNGNLAIPAAKLGAQVTGLDFVPDLIRQADERAQSENLEIRFDVGDAEAMPYEENEFDFVVTMFGAMFCPQTDVIVNELLRVCKPGGTIAMANWTPEGFIGRFFKLGASYLPPPPGVPSPISWGAESNVTARFGNKVSDLKFNKVMLNMHMQMPAPEVVEHFIKYFGPTNKLYEILNYKNKMKFRSDLEELFSENNISGSEDVIVESEYLQVTARKLQVES